MKVELMNRTTTVLFCLLFVCPLSMHSAPSNETRSFDICINAWPNTVLHTFPSGRKWIDVPDESNGATRIYLAMSLSFLETGPAKYDFGPKKHGEMSIHIDRAVETILKKGLNLYVRIYFGSVPGDGILSSSSLPDSLRLDVS